MDYPSSHSPFAGGESFRSSPGEAVIRSALQRADRTGLARAHPAPACPPSRCKSWSLGGGEKWRTGRLL